MKFSEFNIGDNFYNNQDGAVWQKLDATTAACYHDHTDPSSGELCPRGEFDPDFDDPALELYSDYNDADPGDMDGDHDTAMASVGWGTDESYGGTDERY